MRTKIGIIAGVLWVAGCGGPANNGSGGIVGTDVSSSDRLSSGADGGGRAPTHHRESDSQCSEPAPAGTCVAGSTTLGGRFMCVQDIDCTAGENGRCVGAGGPAGCSCTYDTCEHDTDCPSHQTCACHGSPYTTNGNSCVAGNCRVDADCGAGGYCSPSATAGGWCGDVAGYYCHTPNDLCVDDSDCAGAGTDSGAAINARFCEYSTTNARWECQGVALCN